MLPESEGGEMSDRQIPFTREPSERIRDFSEVNLGFDKEKALTEAKRCLQCANPRCREGCPVRVNIPEFIKKLAENDANGAKSVIYEDNILPRVCGRVCPQERQCESRCVLGLKGKPVAIGQLERYAGENGSCDIGRTEEFRGKKVAVAGSGPASLTCAFFLAKKGVEVTVFEAFHVAGGVLVYGIPEFRLPKAVVADEINALRHFGVKFETNCVIGKTVTVEELRRDFDAVFIGTGAGLPMFMNIPGEELSGVYSANEYLTRINLMKAYREGYDTPAPKGGKIVVVGAGNVAMDAARTARRMGAEVDLVYRRGREEMPARAEEIEHAEEEGVNFRLLCNPVEFLGKDRVTGAKCIKMQLGEPDSSGRRRPKEIPGSEFVIDCDAVIVALGTIPNPMIRDTEPKLGVGRKGTIEADERGRTSIKGVYAGGDAVTGAATVILAMGAGKNAAETILEDFGKNENSAE